MSAGPIEEPAGETWGSARTRGGGAAGSAGGASFASDPPTVELGLPRREPAGESEPAEPEPAAMEPADSADEPDTVEQRSADLAPEGQEAAAEQDPPGAGAEQEVIRERSASAGDRGWEQALLEPRGSSREADDFDEEAEQGPGAGFEDAAPSGMQPALSNGSGPPANVARPGALVSESWWQRPEGTLTLAFIAGLVLAGLLKRRRSR